MNSVIEYVFSVHCCTSMLTRYSSKMIAKHVMNIHMNRPNENADENGNAVGEIDVDKMKRYISYCKAYVVITIVSLED